MVEGTGVTRVVFKERGGGGGGVSTRVSSFCSILRAVGFSLWKAQRARLFVAQQLSFTIWGSGPQLYASLLQIPSGASSPVRLFSNPKCREPLKKTLNAESGPSKKYRVWNRV